jgi:hypothetical protein
MNGELFTGYGVQPRGLPDEALHQLVIVAEHAERWAYVFRKRT